MAKKLNKVDEGEKQAIIKYLSSHTSYKRSKKDMIAELRGYIKQSEEHVKEYRSKYQLAKHQYDLFRGELAARKAALKELQKRK